MTDKDYSNEVIDLKFKEVHTRFDSQDQTLGNILKQVEFTNGKVRKIIIALVAIGGVVVGMLFEPKEIVSALIGALSL